VELDLRLIGEGVIEHATNAAKFSEFVRRLSLATKHTAKALSRSHAWSEHLLIEALAPGSIRVALRAPEIPADMTKPTHDDVVASTADSTALRKIASMLSLASADDDVETEPLLAALQALPHAAQRALEVASTTAIEAGWEIHGMVRQRRHAEEPVTLTKRGAERLRSALKLNPSPPVTITMVVTVDGIKHSLATAYFKRDGRGHAFAASLPTEDLIHDVAHLVDDPTRLVRATFIVYVTSSPDGLEERRSQALQSISPLADPGEQVALDLDA
jgi:hypothetical protein